MGAGDRAAHTASAAAADTALAPAAAAAHQQQVQPKGVADALKPAAGAAAAVGVARGAAEVVGGRHLLVVQVGQQQVGQVAEVGLEAQVV